MIKKKNIVIKHIQIFSILFLLFFFLTLTSLISTDKTFAITNSNSFNSFSMSPMYEKTFINPGESYTGSFKIRALDTMTHPFYYKIYTQPYYRTEDNLVIFQNINNRSQIIDWTTIDIPETGSINPGESKTIHFTIHVPKDAPTGGQYMAIIVGSDAKGNENNNITIQESVAMGYTIYAEINGDTIHQGDIVNSDIPSFVINKNISGSSIVKNTGNVHSDAIYKLQVSSLFSDKIIYTNEDRPETHLVLPDRTLYNETKWDNTPIVGIFNVTYSVEFEGKISTITKLVIVCPAWLLIIIFIIIVFLIVWLFVRAKIHKNSKLHF